MVSTQLLNGVDKRLNPAIITPPQSNQGNKMNDVVAVERESKNAVGYVGARLSRKQVKIMMMNAKTPDERKTLATLMPPPHKRHK